MSETSVRVEGFTLIELLVVLAIVALLLTIATPRYIAHVERAREAALRTDLKVMREAIDHFDEDQGHLPASLAELVDRRYLKEIPIDPITNQRDTWIAIAATEVDPLTSGPAQPPPVAPQVSSAGAADPANGAPQSIADVRSGADGKARDGSMFRDW